MRYHLEHLKEEFHISMYFFLFCLMVLFFLCLNVNFVFASFCVYLEMFDVVLSQYLNISVLKNKLFK